MSIEETKIKLERMEQMVEELRLCTGKYEKQYCIREYPDLKNYLYYTYNPYYKFYLKSNTLNNFYNALDILTGYHITLEDLLDDLRTRTIVGNSAREHVKNFLSLFPEHDSIILSILDKDLDCGISVKTINEVYPKLIPEFNAPLAKDYNPNKHEVTNELHFVSRKLDGIRCFTFIESILNEIHVEHFSREGNQFFTLSKITNEIKSKWNIKSSMVIDGEICIIDDNGQESFNGIQSLLRRKDYTIGNPMLKVFDIYTKEEFINKKGYLMYSQTLEEYKNIFKDYSYVSWLEQVEVESLDQFNNIPFGWEGYILRRNSPTMFKRSHNLLKVKNFIDGEFVVQDLVESKKRINGEEVNCIGSLMIRYKDEPVFVGSGLTDNQRVSWYDNPEDVIGKTITVKYFSESMNKEGKLSLRFPTLKMVH